MGSSCDLRKITGAKTAIHKFDLDIIRTGKNPKLHPTNAIGKVFSLFLGKRVSKGKPNLPMYADSIEKTNDSIKKVISLSPKMIYCGHGGSFSLDEIKCLSESF